MSGNENKESDKVPFQTVTVEVWPRFDAEKNRKSKPVLLGMKPEDISLLFPNEPKYVGEQICGFLYDGKNFDEMTSLKKSTRESLNTTAVGNPVKIRETYKSRSGAKKYLFELTDGNLIEGVYMPHAYGDTLCISTQIGCRMGCKFCASGLDGLVRNLTSAEMLGQVIAANADNSGTARQRAVTNVVLMGSGEPFDNYDNVLEFLTALSGGGLKISERNVSLSTCGLADKIRMFADSGHKITLSVSLHSPFDEKRSALMPVNKKFKVSEVVSAAKYYFEKTGRRVIFEYTLIDGENDGKNCAEELKRLTAGFPSHINLIRLNPVKERKFKAASEDSTERFRAMLEILGVSATVRRSLGGDVEGACGQLRRRYVKNNYGEGGEKH